MGKDKDVLELERDFFVRELESMGWGMAAAAAVAGGDAGDVAFGEEAPGAPNGTMGTEWEGPLQMEGW